MARRKKKSSEWDQLVEATEVGRADYHPMVGYLHADGSVVGYNVADVWTPTLRWAISKCFGSIAKRMRPNGTWDEARNNRGEPVAALMMVQRSGRVVWRCRVDFKEGSPSARAVR